MPQPKHTRELPQLVETKGLGEDVGVLPIRRNIRKFDFTREETLADKMVVHLNVLSPGVENGVRRKLDVAEVVIVDRCRIRCLHLQILEYPFRSSILGLCAQQCNCRLLLATPLGRSVPKRDRESGCASAIADVSGPINICVAD